MPHSNIALLLIHAWLVVGCALLPMPTECYSTEANDGWVPISEPPPSLPEQRPSNLARIVIWFENADLSQVRACDRPRGNFDCYHEKYTTFELRGEKWVEADDDLFEQEIICVH